MANKKISELTISDALVGTEIVPVVQSGVTKRTTLSIIMTFFNSAVATLTNKTLTTPVISSISNTGTLTLPTSTDTLVGKATTDVLTNKTFDTAGAGNVLKVNGTAISAVTGTGSGVLATSPALVTPDIGAATGTSLSTTGNHSVTVAGSGFLVKEGSNAKQGVVTLVAGASVVSNTSITATSRILLTSQVDGGTPGWLRVSARSVGTSFTITSSNVADTSVVAFQIFEPA